MPKCEVHATAIVETGARLGDGVRIGPFCHVGKDVGLVHRLDRETSGVTVFGKTKHATAVLSAAFSLGLLFHSFFIEWTEVIVTREGIALRPVGHAWLNRQPRLVPWDRVQGMNQVITRKGGHLEIAAGSQVLKLDRALFREDTFQNMVAALAQRTRQWGPAGYDDELAAAA